MRKNGFAGVLLTLAVCALALLGASAALRGAAAENAAAEELQMLRTLLPGSETFAPEPYDGEDETVTAVFKGETGFVVETTTRGYVDDIVMLTGVDNSGAVTGTVVRSLHETYGLGRRALDDLEFLSQFLGTTGAAAVGETVDALTGATVTAKAVARSVNAASAVVSGADVTASATEWGG